MAAGGQVSVSVPSRILLHLPNALTVSRILLIPVFVLFFLEPTPERSIMAAAVFGLRSLGAEGLPG